MRVLTRTRQFTESGFHMDMDRQQSHQLGRASTRRGRGRGRVVSCTCCRRWGRFCKQFAHRPPPLACLAVLPPGCWLQDCAPALASNAACINESCLARLHASVLCYARSDGQHDAMLVCVDCEHAFVSAQTSSSFSFNRDTACRCAARTAGSQLTAPGTGRATHNAGPRCS